MSTKEKLVTVNSCLASYGTPSNFKINLDDVKSDKIVDIQLRTAIIPKTWLTIDASNNLFYKDGTLMTMPSRNYANGNELASVLSSILMVPVHFSTIKSKLVFQASSFPFTLGFPQLNGCHQVFGFEQKEYSISDTVAPRTINLRQRRLLKLNFKIFKRISSLIQILLIIVSKKSYPFAYPISTEDVNLKSQ